MCGAWQCSVGCMDYLEAVRRRVKTQKPLLAVRRLQSPIGGRPATSAPAPRFSRASLLGHRRPGGLDLRLHGVEVEARALLHRRELDRGHGQLLDLLLDEHEAPELVFEPGEVVLRPGLGPVVGPARALERIEAKVGQVGHVRLGLVAQPAAGLVDEAVLVVVDAHGTELAFAEIPDLVAASTVPCR